MSDRFSTPAPTLANASGCKTRETGLPRRRDARKANESVSLDTLGLQISASETHSAGVEVFHHRNMQRVALEALPWTRQGCTQQHADGWGLVGRNLSADGTGEIAGEQQPTARSPRPLEPSELLHGAALTTFPRAARPKLCRAHGSRSEAQASAGNRTLRAHALDRVTSHGVRATIRPAKERNYAN